MKIIIIYATRSGVSRKCAQMLADRLDSDAMNVELFDIEDAPPSPEEYDVCVIGGSIRMGSLNKKLKKYLKENADALNRIQTALFLCCGFSEQVDDYITLNFPKNIIPSLDIHYFGGEIKPDKVKGMDKLILKAVISNERYNSFDDPDPHTSPLPEIIPENIFRLADRIRGLL